MTYNDMKFAEQKRTRKGEFIECETCKTIFYVPRSRILYQERVGTKIRYCSKKCYTKLGDKNPFWGKHHSEETKQKFIENPNRNRFQSIDNPNIHRFGIDYVGKTVKWWKDKLIKEIGKCEGCGFNEVMGILEIHHKDRNHNNTIGNNILLLCPNCHSAEHYKHKDGKYRPGKGRSYES